MPAVPTPGVDTDWGTKLNAHLAVLLEPTTGFLKSGITQVYSGSSTPLTIQDGTSAANSIIIQPTANKSNSSSVGGSLYINNSGSVGVGLGVYSTQASPTGNLAFVRANNATFNQRALRVEHAGSGIGVDINQSGTGIGLQVVASGGATANAHAVAISLANTGSATSCGLSVLSNNQAHSAIQVTGNETGRGTLKITHVGQGGSSDQNASCISLDVQDGGSGTAAQGIFMDSTGASPTTGSMLKIRVGGTGLFVVQANGNIGVGTETQYGSGEQVIGINNANTVPSTNPTGGGVLYCEGGALKYRGSSGTITTLGNA